MKIISIGWTVSDGYCALGRSLVVRPDKGTNPMKAGFLGG